MGVSRAIYVMAVTSAMVVMTLGQMDQAAKDYILEVHNKYRAGEGASNMAKLVWDPKMEQEAASWVANCVYKHKGMGENMAWNSMTSKPQNELIDSAMKAFFDEKSRYSYGQNSCGTTASCHYTQLVWAKTTKVGCATKICEPLTGAYSKAWFLLCRYDPAGNWNGEKPFLMGPACSKCPGATCDGGLCVGGGAADAGGDGGAATGGQTAEVCEDGNASCREWAGRGECQRNKGYMEKNCKKSCGICSGGDDAAQTKVEECKDGNPNCAGWAGRGECRANPSYMNKHCKKSCNKC